MNKNIEFTISNTLKNIGVTPGLLGYKYLRYAIKLALDDQSIVRRITKELYPSIAKHFNTTPSRAERAMRHAIEVAWSEPNEDVRTPIFGRTVRSSTGKPTNCEFIATVADYLLLTGEVRNAS